MSLRIFLGLYLSMMGGALSAGTAEPPRVVVSLAPIHSLVAGVMRNVALPELLISGGASPHDFRLKPSQVRSLNQAQIVFRVGKQEETFLNKTLANRGDRVRVLSLIELPDITLLPTRAGGVWESHHHDDNAHREEQEQHKTPDSDTTPGDNRDHADHKHRPGTLDTHIWLDPTNARAIVKAAVKVLSEIDPGRAAVYQANGDQVLFRLDDLDSELRQTLISAADTPYIVFHDAYQYFEHYYGLNAIGAVTVSPEQRIGARRLQAIRSKIKDSKAHCVFSEPQFPSKQLQVITEGLPVHSGELDPLGTDLTPGPDLYFTLLRRLTSSLVGCLCQI